MNPHPKPQEEPPKEALPPAGPDTNREYDPTDWEEIPPPPWED